MRISFTSLLALASMATTAPTSMRRDLGVQRLLVGGPTQILTARFENNAFSIVGKDVRAGEAPSWMRYKASTNTLYAVNENGVDLNIYSLKRDDPALALTHTNAYTGSSGVVFLEFNKNQTRMVGAAYGSEMIDLWDTSAATPKLLKQIKITGPVGPGQNAHHPHQAIIDPTGRFMVVPDLGGDQLLVVDLKDDIFKVTNSVTLTAGAGPRHGTFIAGSEEGSYYFVVATEKSNLLVLYEAQYNAEQGLAFRWISEQSTFGSSEATPTGAAAGAVLVARNARDIYVSNRLTGAAADSIAHFTFDAAAAKVSFVALTSSTGILPRSMGFSTDDAQSVLFVANQGGDNGLVAFSRHAEDGSIDAKPLGLVPNSQLVPGGFEGQPNVGPQFVAAF